LLSKLVGGLRFCGGGQQDQPILTTKAIQDMDEEQENQIIVEGQNNHRHGINRTKDS
jgi:hypothetical protein